MNTEIYKNNCLIRAGWMDSDFDHLLSIHGKEFYIQQVSDTGLVINAGYGKFQGEGIAPIANQLNKTGKIMNTQPTTAIDTTIVTLSNGLQHYAHVESFDAAIYGKELALHAKTDKSLKYNLRFLSLEQIQLACVTYLKEFDSLLERKRSFSDFHDKYFQDGIDNALRCNVLPACFTETTNVVRATGQLPADDRTDKLSDLFSDSALDSVTFYKVSSELNKTHKNVVSFQLQRHKALNLLKDVKSHFEAQEIDKAIESFKVLKEISDKLTGVKRDEYNAVKVKVGKILADRDKEANNDKAKQALDKVKELVNDGKFTMAKDLLSGLQVYKNLADNLVSELTDQLKICNDFIAKRDAKPDNTPTGNREGEIDVRITGGANLAPTLDDVQEPSTDDVIDDGGDYEETEIFTINIAGYQGLELTRDDLIALQAEISALLG